MCTLSPKLHFGHTAKKQSVSLYSQGLAMGSLAGDLGTGWQTELSVPFFSRLARTAKSVEVCACV